jgi:hypothetical protein
MIRGKDLIALMTGGALEYVESPTAPVGTGTATEFDLEMLDDVVEIIEEFHKTVTFWVYPDAVYAPETGVNSRGDAVQYSKQVMPPYQVELKYVDGDLIQAGDMLSGIPAKDIEFTLEKGMKVTIGSDIWTIVRVSPIYASEWIVLYLFQLRR